MLDAQLDHVAIAVRSIRDAMRIYVDALGASFVFAGDQREQGFRWAQFRFPHGGKIELVTPLSDDGFVARFLERRGEGVHHVTLKVPDIERALTHLRDSGVPLLGVSTSHRSWKEAFIHPNDAHGALIQIAESELPDEDVARHHLARHEASDHRHLMLEDLTEDLPDERRERPRA